MEVVGDATAALADQVIAIAVCRSGGWAGFDDHLRVVAVTIDHEGGGSAIDGFSGTDAIGVVGKAQAGAGIGRRDELVLRVVGVASLAIAQRIAIVVIAVGRIALLRQTVIGVIAEGSRRAIDGLLNAIADLVIAVARRVIAMLWISDGLTGQAIQRIEGVGAGAAVGCADLIKTKSTRPFYLMLV